MRHKAMSNETIILSARHYICGSSKFFARLVDVTCRKSENQLPQPRKAKDERVSKYADPRPPTFEDFDAETAVVGL